MHVFQLIAGEGPLVAAAIHSGHAVRAGVAERLALDESTRRREEDPFTDELAALLPTRFIGRRSRFEFDLNRPREQAIYLKPSDAWGLRVWRGELPAEVMAQSLAHYDLFYATVQAVLASLIERYGRVVVLDLHSYNHRREGAGGGVANPEENPEINIGSASLDRAVWGPLAERFIYDLSDFQLGGRRLDVRENVKFFGGHFPRWIHATFPGQACALAIEFKKTFMDEWNGELDRKHFTALQAALRSTFPGLLAELAKLGVEVPEAAPPSRAAAV